jgi:hypothetical protein
MARQEGLGPQPVQEDARDDGALVGHGSLALHHRRQRHHLVQAEPQLVAQSREPPLVAPLEPRRARAEAAHHAAHHLGGREVVPQRVRVRKQVALGCLARDLQLPQDVRVHRGVQERLLLHEPVVGQALRDVEAREALGHGDIHAAGTEATGHAARQLGGWQVVGQAHALPHAQRVMRPQQAQVEREEPRLFHHALGLERLGQLACAGLLRDGHHHGPPFAGTCAPRIDHQHVDQARHGARQQQRGDAREHTDTRAQRRFRRGRTAPRRALAPGGRSPGPGGGSSAASSLSASGHVSCPLASRKACSKSAAAA